MEYLIPRKDFLLPVEGEVNTAFANANDGILNYPILQQEAMKDAKIVFDLCKK